MGHGGGELVHVYRTGGIDYDNRTEPQRARWFTPQLLVAAGIIKVAGMTVAGASPVPGPGQIQRNGAVHLDEPRSARGPGGASLRSMSGVLSRIGWPGSCPASGEKRSAS